MAMESPAPSGLASEIDMNGTAGDDELFGSASDEEVARYVHTSVPVEGGHS